MVAEAAAKAATSHGMSVVILTSWGLREISFLESGNLFICTLGRAEIDLPAGKVTRNGRRDPEVVFRRDAG